jgi:5-methylthioadenosine/S-adenosylhomocysteine deaminase
MRRTTSVTLGLLMLLGAAWFSPAQAQWTPDTTIVLRGKIVTMTGAAVRNGQVFIKNGVIEKIRPLSEAVPAGAIIIETKGYIYPGLMNLHNHLEYNVVPLYPVPKHTDNRDQWPGGKAYETHVNNPWKVVTDSNIYGLEDEAFKFAEVRSIIGGETTTQGADNNPSISRSLVRNVELENFGVDEVGARTPSLDSLFMKHLPESIDRIKAQKAWIFHMAEGIDEYARKEFSNPAYDPATPIRTTNRPGVVQAGLLWPGLVGVHCTALNEDDYRAWKAATGQPKIVWSPTSNLLLYGKTTDVAAALRQNALIALGSDWAPSGTKSVLWELKAVDQYNRTKLNNLLTERQIVEMATVNAAKMVGWESRVGKIQPGMAADLLVIDDLRPTAGGGYRNLLNATEVNVQLVLVGGNPLYGDEKHMRRLKTYNNQPRYEVLPETAGARPKAIDMLENPEARSGTLSVAEIRRRLENALSLDMNRLAARLNEGVQETATRKTYDSREYVKAELVKLLTKKNKPVPASLRDPEAAITAEQAAEFIALKYPNVRAGPRRLETLYTDARFFDDIAANLHWREPYSAGVNFAGYAPTSATPGFAGSVPGQ